MGSRKYVRGSLKVHNDNINNSKNQNSKDQDEKIPKKLTGEVEEVVTFLQTNRKNMIELQKVFKPYSWIVANHLKTNLKLQILIFTIVAVVTLYVLSYFELFSWTFSAIGRLLLIQLLPIFDWRYLAEEQCLVPLPISSKITTQLPPDIDCILCQGIEKIDVKDDVNQEDLNELFVSVHKPLIIGTAVKKWKDLANTTELNHFLTTDAVMSNSIPCEISTNVFNGICEVQRLIKRLNLFENYFLQFQNCELSAVKQLRLLIPRPPFLPVELAPIQYSWIFVSKDFYLNKYKNVELRDRVAIFVQLVGKNNLKLIPNTDCEQFCPVIDFELNMGEAVIFTHLWNLEYKPDPKTENFAFALETH